MTAHSDSPALIGRREAIRRATLLLGGAISAPTLAAMLAGCETPPVAERGWTPAALSDEQGALVATIADHIIPETDTPGARAVGVHRFIDKMLAEYYSPDQKAAFLQGLSDVDRRANDMKGKKFLRLSAAEQHDVLAALDAEAFHAPPKAAAAAAAKAADPERDRTENATADQRKNDTARNTPVPKKHPPFFRTMKELTVLGYYTSEIGMTRELKHAPVPGKFQGCVPFAQIGRAWAV